MEAYMRFQALATDYDGTIARHGKVSEGALQSLRELLATGRRLILVTGRELPELLQILPDIELFDWVVAENGGLLYQPSTKQERPLADPPSAPLLALPAVIPAGASPLLRWRLRRRCSRPSSV